MKFKFCHDYEVFHKEFINRKDLDGAIKHIRDKTLILEEFQKIKPLMDKKEFIEFLINQKSDSDDSNIDSIIEKCYNLGGESETDPLRALIDQFKTFAVDYQKTKENLEAKKNAEHEREILKIYEKIREYLQIGNEIYCNNCDYNCSNTEWHSIVGISNSLIKSEPAEASLEACTEALNLITDIVNQGSKFSERSSRVISRSPSPSNLSINRDETPLIIEKLENNLINSNLDSKINTTAISDKIFPLKTSTKTETNIHDDSKLIKNNNQASDSEQNDAAKSIANIISDSKIISEPKILSKLFPSVKVDKDCEISSDNNLSFKTPVEDKNTEISKNTDINKLESNIPTQNNNQDSKNLILKIIDSPKLKDICETRSYSDSDHENYISSEDSHDDFSSFSTPKFEQKLKSNVSEPAHYISSEPPKIPFGAISLGKINESETTSFNEKSSLVKKADIDAIIPPKSELPVFPASSSSVLGFGQTRQVSSPQKPTAENLQSIKSDNKKESSKIYTSAFDAKKISSSPSKSEQIQTSASINISPPPSDNLKIAEEAEPEIPHVPFVKDETSNFESFKKEREIETDGGKLLDNLIEKGLNQMDIDDNVKESSDNWSPEKSVETESKPKNALFNFIPSTQISLPAFPLSNLSRSDTSTATIFPSKNSSIFSSAQTQIPVSSSVSTQSPTIPAQNSTMFSLAQTQLPSSPAETTKSSIFSTQNSTLFSSAQTQLPSSSAVTTQSSIFPAQNYTLFSSAPAQLPSSSAVPTQSSTFNAQNLTLFSSAQSQTPSSSTVTTELPIFPAQNSTLFSSAQSQSSIQSNTSTQLPIFPAKNLPNPFLSVPQSSLSATPITTIATGFGSLSSQIGQNLLNNSSVNNFNNNINNANSFTKFSLGAQNSTENQPAFTTQNSLSSQTNPQCTVQSLKNFGNSLSFTNLSSNNVNQLSSNLTQNNSQLNQPTASSFAQNNTNFQLSFQQQKAQNPNQQIQNIPNINQQTQTQQNANPAFDINKFRTSFSSFSAANQQVQNSTQSSGAFGSQIGSPFQSLGCFNNLSLNQSSNNNISQNTAFNQPQNVQKTFSSFSNQNQGQTAFGGNSQNNLPSPSGLFGNFNTQAPKTQFSQFTSTGSNQPNQLTNNLSAFGGINQAAGFNTAQPQPPQQNQLFGQAQQQVQQQQAQQSQSSPFSIPASFAAAKSFGSPTASVFGQQQSQNTQKFNPMPTFTSSFSSVSDGSAHSGSKSAGSSPFANLIAQSKQNQPRSPFS